MSRPPYIPRMVRGVELRTPKLPHEPNYQPVPASQASAPEAAEISDLEATRIPFGPHKNKTLIQLLNDHPGYLANLRDDAFTDHEEFELKVEQFCAKYEHRLSRATGGSSTSILWAASICAF